MSAKPNAHVLGKIGAVIQRGGPCAVCHLPVSPLGAHFRSGSVWEHQQCHDIALEQRVQTETEARCGEVIRQRRAEDARELDRVTADLRRAERRANELEANNRRLVASGLLGSAPSASASASAAPPRAPGTALTAQPSVSPPRSTGNVLSAPSSPSSPSAPSAPEMPKDRFALLDLD